MTFVDGRVLSGVSCDDMAFIFRIEQFVVGCKS